MRTWSSRFNHEFDLGPENLLERVRESKFIWVTANVRDRPTGDAFGAEAGVKKFTILTVNGTSGRRCRAAPSGSVYVILTGESP